MQRNHHTSAMLRACRQVPNWANWGGRQEPYAIEWIAAGSSNYYYTKTDVTTHNINTSMTMWLRVTDTIGTGIERGVFAISNAPFDAFSVQVEHDATGNRLRVYLLGTQISDTLIGTNWANLTINFAPMLTEVWVNGVMEANPAVQFQGVITGYTLGRTDAGGGLKYLDNCIVDEIAFFSVLSSPVLLYNNGVPLHYGMNYPSLISSHEVEKSTGSIRATAIPARYFQTGTSPAAFNWMGLGGALGGVVKITSNTLRSSTTNALSRMADHYSQYGKGVADIAWDNRTPIGTAKNLEDKANGLMPYPAGGGFSTIGGTNPMIGGMKEPDMTPIVSKPITIGSNGDSTSYPTSGGTGSLSGVTDARTVRLFAPLFVKKP